jgi:hypothetical protein
MQKRKLFSREKGQAFDPGGWIRSAQAGRSDLEKFF